MENHGILETDKRSRCSWRLVHVKEQDRILDPITDQNRLYEVIVTTIYYYIHIDIVYMSYMYHTFMSIEKLFEKKD